MVKFRRDYYAGGLMILIGVGAVFEASTYKQGTLMHMGPGFFPVALGCVLTLLGMMIAGVAVGSTPEGDERIIPENPQWVGWACIIGSPLAFMILGTYFGMIPATFGCVFVAALGDRTSTWLGSFILAACVTTFGVLLFSYLLQVPFPLLRWGSP